MERGREIEKGGNRETGEKGRQGETERDNGREIESQGETQRDKGREIERGRGDRELGGD